MTLEEHYPNKLLPVGARITIREVVGLASTPQVLERTVLVGDVNEVGGRCDDCNIWKAEFVREELPELLDTDSIRKALGASVSVPVEISPLQTYLQRKKEPRETAYDFSKGERGKYTKKPPESFIERLDNPGDTEPPKG